MENAERKTRKGQIISKLGDGPVAILDMPSLGTGRQVTRIVSGEVTDVRTFYFSATSKIRYPRRIFRMGENDMSDIVAEGANGEKLIFSRPLSRPSVPVELSEN